MAKRKTWPIKVAVIHHRHGVDIFTGWTEREAKRRVYQYVKEWWDEFCSDRGDLPKDVDKAIEAYFEAAGDSEYLDMMGDFLPVRKK